MGQILSQKEQMPIIPNSQRERRIWVTGATGAGMSSVIKLLTNNPDIKTAISLESITTEYKGYPFNDTIELLDGPSLPTDSPSTSLMDFLSTPKNKSENHIDQIANQGLSMILYVINRTRRLFKEDRANFELISKRLKGVPIVLVFTHCEFSISQEFLEKLKNEMTYCLNSNFNDSVCVCSIDLTDRVDDPDMKLNEQCEQSKTALVDMIKRWCLPKNIICEQTK
jgi:GTP-binding protein EngB required for normal cell division